MKSKFAELQKRHPHDEILKALKESNTRRLISLEARDSLATLYIKCMEAKDGC